MPANESTNLSADTSYLPYLNYQKSTISYNQITEIIPIH